MRQADRIRRAVLSNNITPELSPDVLRQGFLETADLVIAVDQLSREPQDPLWKEKLKMAIGGQGLPQQEGEESPARDIQFELTIAAMCRVAGLSVTLAEPDVVVTGMPFRFGVAAKRLKSFGSLEQHIRKARRQIVGAGLDGIIALDISSSVHQENRTIFETDAHRLTAWTEAAAGRFVDHYSPRIMRWLRERRVFGVAVYCKALVCTREGRYGTARRWSVFNTCPQTDIRYEHLRMFAARMASIQ